MSGPVQMITLNNTEKQAPSSHFHSVTVDVTSISGCGLGLSDPIQDSGDWVSCLRVFSDQGKCSEQETFGLCLTNTGK